MNDRPHSWVECAIGDVCGVVGGGTPPSKDPGNFTEEGGTPWITPADLSGYRAKLVARGRRNLTPAGLKNSAARVMPSGTVLFSSRAPVGYVAIAANPVATNQGFKSFLLPEGLDSSYVYYYLRHIKPEAEARATGTTFKELSGAAAAKLPLLIAPTTEQERIASKLDAVLAAVEVCRDRLDRVPNILKRFREAVLEAAVSGRLTEEWRAEKHISFNSWKETVLGDLVLDIRYGSATKCSYEPHNLTPVLRIPNVAKGQIDTSDLKYGRLEEGERKRLSLMQGDLLVVRSNGSLDLVGRAAVVPAGFESFAFAGYLIRLRPDPSKVDSQYIALVLGSPTNRAHIAVTARSTSGVNNLNSEELRRIECPLPGRLEQTEIVRRVGELFALANSMERRYEDTANRVDRLTPSILAKAFRGELVPQDPKEESAADLLHRILARRAS